MHARERSSHYGCIQIFQDNLSGGDYLSIRAQLTGQKFGKLTVLERGEDYISPSGSHLLRWKCQCDCGNIINATTSQLKRGLSSCGCKSRREDLVGHKYGKLTVLYAPFESFLEK